MDSQGAKKPRGEVGNEASVVRLSSRNTQYATLIFLLAILLATIFRLWQLDTMPPGFYHDEAYNALDALSLLEGRTFPQFYEGWELYRFEAHGERGALETRTPIFFEGNYGREPFHIYLMALSMRIFGTTPWTTRLVPALAGIASVVTTAIAAWHIAPKQQRVLVAVFAAFAVAILFPAIHFSRFGLRAMLFVPVETLCVAAFWYVHNLSSRDPQSTAVRIAATVIVGILLGFGLYVYAAARLFPLLFVVFCAWCLWRYPEQRRQLFGRYTLIATIAFLVVLPLLLYFAAYPYFLFFRSAYVAQNGAGVVEGRPFLTVGLNFGRILRGFIWQGETHLRHNLPGRPYLDAIQLILLLLGFWQAARWRTDRRLFLFVWFFVMLLPSALSSDAPHFGRLTGLVPVAAIVIAIGLNSLFTMLAQRFSVPLAQRAMLLILATSAFWTGYDYFVRYANHPDIATDFYLADRQLGEWAAQMPNDIDFFLTPTRQHLATIQFALGTQRGLLRNYRAEPSTMLFGRTDTPTIHLVNWQEMDAAVVQRLEQFGDVKHFLNEQWVAIELFGGVEFVTDGTVGSVRVSAEIDQSTNQLSTTLRWQPTTPLPTNLTAFVHILDPDGNIIAQTDREPAGYPTSDWQPNELIEDTFVIPLVGELCDRCRVMTGFYDTTTGARLGEPLDITAQTE